MTYEEVNSKTREEVIEIVWKKMVAMAGKGWNYEKYREVTDIISDWNSEHYEDYEIFMCDDVNENGERIGLYLEDDHVIFED